MDADSELIQEQSRAIKGLFSARGVLQMFPSFLAEGGCWSQGLVDQELVLERLCEILWGGYGDGAAPAEGAACTAGLTAAEISFSLFRNKQNRVEGARRTARRGAGGALHGERDGHRVTSQGLILLQA